MISSRTFQSMKLLSLTRSLPSQIFNFSGSYLFHFSSLDFLSHTWKMATQRDGSIELTVDIFPFCLLDQYWYVYLRQLSFSFYFNFFNSLSLPFTCVCISPHPIVMNGKHWNNVTISFLSLIQRVCDDYYLIFWIWDFFFNYHGPHHISPKLD